MEKGWKHEHHNKESHGGHHMHHEEHGKMKHEQHGRKDFPDLEEPKLPDESGWYTATPRNHRDGNALSARTGAVLTSAAVGIFILGLVLILLMAILYRKRKRMARRQRSMAQAQQNLYISGMRFNEGAMDNPTYVVPLNDEEKKVPLDVSGMVTPGEYPALLPPSYQEAVDQCGLPPSYSLDPDDHPDEVPVLRRLSITLPGETMKDKSDQHC